MSENGEPRTNPRTKKKAKAHKAPPSPDLVYTDSQRRQCINALTEADSSGTEIDYAQLARRIGKSEEDARAIVAMGYRS